MGTLNRGLLYAAQVEFMGVLKAVKEVIWLKGPISELGYDQDTIELICYNQSPIHLTKNQEYHDKTKHIDVKVLFVHDIIEKWIMSIQKVVKLSSITV